MNEVGAPKFDLEDEKFSTELFKTFPKGTCEELIQSAPHEFKELMREIIKKPLCHMILPPMGKGEVIGGSTDVGDVSWKVPTSGFHIACSPIGCPSHSWQYTACSGMSIGHKGMIAASKILALSAFDFMNDPELVSKAKEEFIEWTKGKPYKSPLPDGLIPPFRQYDK
jgi:aminobenzoyl-glutamate utilization protein B